MALTILKVEKKNHKTTSIDLQAFLLESEGLIEAFKVCLNSNPVKRRLDSLETGKKWKKINAFRLELTINLKSLSLVRKRS
jgi:hypothetical protein